MGVAFLRLVMESFRSKVGASYLFLFLSLLLSGCGGAGQSGFLGGTSPNTTQKASSADPEITDIQILGLTLSTATIGWNTDIESTSVIEYGQNNILSLSVKDSQLVKAHSVQITGLQAGSMITFRVRSVTANSKEAFSGIIPLAIPATDLTPPSVPAGTTVTALSSSSLKLDWMASSDASGIKGYNIVQTSPASGSAIPQQVSNTYTVSGLNSNSQYCFTVQAVDNANNVSTASTAFCGATLDIAPAAPSVFSAVAASVSQINLSWIDNSNNESGFKIERGSAAAGPFNQIATVAAGIISYVDTGLSASTTYYYRVRSYNAIGNSSYTSVASATTSMNADLTAPSVPVGATVTALSSSSLKLDWMASSDASGIKGYNIVQTSPASGSAIPQQVSNTYTVSSLNSNSQYCFTVQAVDNANNVSTASTAFCGATLDISPAAPSALSAVAASVSQINLSWTDNSNNESGFKIERGSAAAGPFTQIAAVAAGATSYSNTGLSASTTYYYRVRSYNAIGNSNYTSVASATTSAPSALATLAISSPSLSQAKASSTVTYTITYSNATSITLSAANVTLGTTGSASCASSVVSGSGTTTRTITLSSCSGDGTVKISIAANTAQNSAGVQAVAAGPSSAFTVDNTAPSVPANFVASAASSSAINLSWAASSDAGSGIANYSLQLASGTVVATPTATSFQATGLNVNAQYCYRVNAIDSLGNASAL